MPPAQPPDARSQPMSGSIDRTTRPQRRAARRTPQRRCPRPASSTRVVALAATSKAERSAVSRCRLDLLLRCLASCVSPSRVVDGRQSVGATVIDGALAPGPARQGRARISESEFRAACSGRKRSSVRHQLCTSYKSRLRSKHRRLHAHAKRGDRVFEACKIRACRPSQNESATGFTRSL